MTTALAAAFAEFKPQIEDRFSAQVTGSCQRLIADLGVSLKGVGNSWTWAKAFRNRLASVMTRTGGERTAAGTTPVVYYIDEAKIAAQASTYADTVIEAWQGKINVKMGELEAATVNRGDGFSFHISGTRAGRAVMIVQQMIVNYRDHTPYNQFPALIYVDGKKTSEAAYKKIFA